MKLTSRQKTLLSRLLTLGERATSGTLPIAVIEIIGFGSFFRGKESPKDVDLIIRCTREHSRAFASFRELLHRVRKDVKYQDDFKRPLAALLYEYDKGHRDLLPGFESLNAQRETFSEWLEPYSWSMLFPKSFVESLGWDDPVGFTRRLLRRTAPNLNVVSFYYPETKPEKFGLRAGFTETLWSRERPDIERNLLAILAPEHVLANTLKELEHFNKQLFLLRGTLAVLKIKIQNDLGMSDNRISASLSKSLGMESTLLTEEEIKSELGLEYSGESLTDPSNLSAVVEGCRAEVKELWTKVEAARDIDHLLKWHRHQHGAAPADPAEFLEEELLNGKTRPQQDSLKTLLREFELLPIG